MFSQKPKPNFQQQVLSQLAALNLQGVKIMALLDALTAQVTATQGAEQSAIVLIQGLAAKIQALIAASGNTVDPAQLQTIVDELNTSATAVGAAVAANPVPA